MIGYVAADNRGPMDIADATRETRLATRLKRSRATKGAPVFAVARSERRLRQSG